MIIHGAMLSHVFTWHSMAKTMAIASHCDCDIIILDGQITF